MVHSQSHWKGKLLVDYPLSIIDGDRGKAYPKSTDFVDQDYCLFLNAGNVTKTGFDFDTTAFVSKERDSALRKGRLQRSDIVLTTRGTVGNVAYFDDEVPYENIRINSGMVILRPFEELNPKFLYLLLRSRLFADQVASLTSGSAQPQLPIRDIHQISLPLPSRTEQDAIAETLGALDDRIEANRRMNGTLEAMARAVFRDWFVDFGPTRRQLAGASDPHAILGGLIEDAGGMAGKVGTGFPSDMPTNHELATRLAPLFPARLGENGLPEGWGEHAFGELLSDSIGGDWGKEVADENHTDPIHIIRGTDFAAIEDGYVGKVPKRYTTQKKLHRRELEHYDILLEVSGGSPTQPTGRSLLITNSILNRFDTPVVCASFCRRLRPKSHAFALYLNEHLKNLYAEGGTWEYQNQSTGISNFQTKHFLEAERVIHPPEAVRLSFASFVEPLVGLATRNENRTLAATRDLLLPKLMSGEIRLKDAEAMV